MTQMQQRKKVIKRIEVLIKTTLPIHEVAEHSGYATFEHFATYFKKRYGKTPCAFRAERSLDAAFQPDYLYFGII